MTMTVFRNKWILIGISILLIMWVNGCGGGSKASRGQKGQLDNPQYHTLRGDDALMSKDYESAHASYKKALELDSNYSDALSGEAVVNAYRAANPDISQQTKEDSLKKSEEFIEKALDSAGDDPGKLTRAHSFGLQVYVALQLPEKDWYDKATDHFKEATDLQANNPEPYFYMAKAEAANMGYEKAARHLNRVLSIGGKLEAEANAELKRIQRIQRAMPGSLFGAKIANQDFITRADVAALFMAEMRLDKLYQNRGAKASNSFQAPSSQQKMNTDPIQAYPDAVDLTGHPLKSTIEDVIKIGIKGLEPDPSHKFYPDQKITRSEFSLMIQDIMIKVTKDDSYETKFIGQDSPFPDVRSDAWYYNATRVVVDRGFLEVKNKVTGDFDPSGNVSGADALLSIRNLKEFLKTYLR